MKKFSLNLSFISAPCVLTDAMVVSEIIDKLSPNIAPDTTAPIQIATGKLVSLAIPTAIGAKAVIVPIDVPIDMDIKHPIKNRPTIMYFAGSIDNPKLTVLSTPPAALTIPENAPATKNIKIIVMILTSPAPLAIISNFLLKESFLFCNSATNNATKNATNAGIA